MHVYLALNLCNLNSWHLVYNRAYPSMIGVAELLSYFPDIFYVCPLIIIAYV